MECCAVDTVSGPLFVGVLMPMFGVLGLNRNVSACCIGEVRLERRNGLGALTTTVVAKTNY